MSNEILKLSALVRVALMVADLQRSRDFYANVLGVDHVYWEGTLNGLSVERLLGVASGSLCHVVVLAPDATTMGMVGLFEVTNPRPNPAVRAQGTIQTGEAFLVFYASDLDLVTARALAGGYEVFCAAIPLEHEGQVKQREMTLVDPDGVKVNLIEWDPALASRPGLPQRR